jgi:alkanesulfonate monooxygenase SsuD/methylene tetrahydromethanopterin reductase-like flavin-dependent oxidoreductase (luciferase family)
MTNLLSRPAPILARTVTGLSDISGGRVILGTSAGGIEDEIAALGVPRLSPGARIRALEEAITVVRDVGTIYIVPGAITRNPLPETRDEDGRWIGGGVTQWVEELTSAVL